MTISLTGFLILLIIAGICGAVGRSLGGGTSGGFAISIVVGFIGALLGLLIAHQAHTPEILAVTVDGRSFPIFWSVLGGAFFVALLNLATRRPLGTRWRHYRRHL